MVGSHIRHHQNYRRTNTPEGGVVNGVGGGAINGIENGHDNSIPNGNGMENGNEFDEVLGDREGLEPIPQDLLQKYVVYSKEKVHPKLHQMDQDKVAKLYADLRKESMVCVCVCVCVCHV